MTTAIIKKKLEALPIILKGAFYEAYSLITDRLLCAFSLVNAMDNSSLAYEEPPIPEQILQCAEAMTRVAGMMGGTIVAAMVGINPVAGMALGYFSPEISSVVSGLGQITQTKDAPLAKIIAITHSVRINSSHIASNLGMQIRNRLNKQSYELIDVIVDVDLIVTEK